MPRQVVEVLTVLACVLFAVALADEGLVQSPDGPLLGVVTDIARSFYVRPDTLKLT